MFHKGIQNKMKKWCKIYLFTFPFLFTISYLFVVVENTRWFLKLFPPLKEHRRYVAKRFKTCNPQQHWPSLLLCSKPNICIDKVSQILMWLTCFGLAGCQQVGRQVILACEVLLICGQFHLPFGTKCKCVSAQQLLVQKIPPQLEVTPNFYALWSEVCARKIWVSLLIQSLRCS